MTFKEFANKAKLVIDKLNNKLKHIAIPNDIYTKNLIKLYMNYNFNVKDLLEVDDNPNKMAFRFVEGHVYVFFELSNEIWTIKIKGFESIDFDNPQIFYIINKIVNAFK